jgi:hypothetical protein
MAEKKQSEFMKSGTENRRDFLRKGLIAASGLTFGFSVIKDVWAQQRTMQRSQEMKVMPQRTVAPRAPGHFTLAPVKKQRAVQNITPTLKNLLDNAGVTIDSKEMDALQKAFAQRGTINIPGGDPGVASTLSISGSVTWK